jgi:hypothetical protein
MHKYVQTPRNIYFTFCKSVEHDEKDYRDSDVMNERLGDTYRIEGELQSEGNIAQFNSPGRGNFNHRGGFRGRGRQGGMGRG